ncbi:MAG TPA: helix-turn-helix transcriptional regulator [Pseudobdellovibrionaceae bacterium]|nr:helix-turn-helix transcriptional regulator [Pseudobdellovibrionaceae bacterium]
MAYKLDYSKVDPFQLNVFSESRKRRTFVGNLNWDQKKNNFEFSYDPKYAKSKTAIPVGRELDLFKKTHTSKGKLFPSFADRIPSRENPAYEDYCESQGISASETNPIILLISIGKRGPSTFIFEPVFPNTFDYKRIREFRESLQLSIHEFAAAFDFNPPTLQRLELGKKSDPGTITRAQIYLDFPQVALWQLELNSGKIHAETFHKLWSHFEKRKV